MSLETPISSADYIIVGGGTAGCTLAARLQKRLPSSSILVIEAGPDPSDDELVLNASGATAVRQSHLAWQLEILPNENLGDRKTKTQVGKALGGSAPINAGAWTRGPSCDYDLWAKVVGDKQWGYESLLPFFRKTETDHQKEINEKQHGYDGPLHATSVVANFPSRMYPLRDSVKSAWEEAGVQYIPDPNTGHPLA